VNAHVNTLMRQDVNTLRLIRAGLAPRTGIGPAGALASADSSDERDQDRYLMTTPAPRSRKVVCSLSWFSTSRGSTRSNIQVSHQFTQQSSSFDPDRHLLIARVAGRQPVAPRSLPSVTSAAALKSPCARGISPRSLSAVSSLEVFGRRPSVPAGIRKPSQNRPLQALTPWNTDDSGRVL
jgi:hypothetical protein